MAIEKRTVVDQRELTSTGIIQIRFLKEIVEDGNVLSFEYHRTSIKPGQDVDEVMASVNSNLLQMNCTEVSPDEIDKIRRVIQVEHTPEVIAAFKQAQIAALATKGLA